MRVLKENPHSKAKTIQQTQLSYGMVRIEPESLWGRQLQALTLLSSFCCCILLYIAILVGNLDKTSNLLTTNKKINRENNPCHPGPKF